MIHTVTGNYCLVWSCGRSLTRFTVARIRDVLCAGTKAACAAHRDTRGIDVRRSSLCCTMQMLNTKMTKGVRG
jgi:hypothetical protein